MGSKRTVTLLAGTLAVALGAPHLAAQDGGWYLGLEMGTSLGSPLPSSVSGVNHPTRCDVLLYPPGMAPPDDPACSDTVPALMFANELMAGSGFTSGLALGYDMGRVRIELEYLSRYQGETSGPLGSTDNAALISKNTEWATSAPPTEHIHDISGQQFFVNAYFDLTSGGDWTPYFGGGAGMADTQLSYDVDFTRKPELEYLAIDFETDWPDEAKRAAAGTSSILAAQLSGGVFGFQLIAGVDRALGDRASIGLKARWSRFGSLSDQVIWTQIRSHAPVRADGSTPFDSTIDFTSMEHRALTLTLKYQL